MATEPVRPEGVPLWTILLSVVLFSFAFAGYIRYAMPMARADAADFRTVQLQLHSRETRELSQADGWAPIAVWTPSDKRLDVTDHLPADALVCIRGECELAQEWKDRADLRVSMQPRPRH